MEFNRNQFFMAGMLILLLGVQFRSVETFVLNERTTQVLAQRIQAWKQPQMASTGNAPPKWLGWALVSVGSVLLLHSLSLKKPGG
jgi:hypothetical protein